MSLNKRRKLKQNNLKFRFWYLLRQKPSLFVFKTILFREKLNCSMISIFLMVLLITVTFIVHFFWIFNTIRKYLLYFLQRCYNYSKTCIAYPKKVSAFTSELYPYRNYIHQTVNCWIILYLTIYSVSMSHGNGKN